MPAIDPPLPVLVRTARRTGAAVLSVGALVALAACAGVADPIDPSVADRTYLGLPAEGGEVHPWSDVDAPEVGYARGGEPQTVNVVTFGSSSCPLVPVDYTWDAGDRELSFLLGRRAGTDERPCTLDTAPSTSVVVVPGLPADEPVTVLTAGGDVILPAGR
ncbi:hypothetical protein [Cellulosimicrobium cellulans]|uniref:hypothetical protein n=1 Tax=Cellulosimicrobium cellulans TaxID=1710 RepID=UPI0020CBB801|nr:hypothetical protein NMQ07_10890 [Cellulosimicrobium cellulans]